MRHTDESRYERARKTTILLLQSLRLPPRQLESSRKAVRKAKIVPIKRTEKDLRTFEFSISLDTTFQEFLEATAQAMRRKVSHIALDELDAKLSMHGGASTRYVRCTEQAWKIHARKLIEA